MFYNVVKQICEFVNSFNYNLGNSNLFYIFVLQKVKGFTFYRVLSLTRKAIYIFNVIFYRVFTE